MEKTEEIRALGKYFFSSSRRRKVGILFKEFLLSVPIINKSESGLAQELPLDPPENTWSSHEVRSIDIDLFNRGTVKVVEDHVQDDGLIHAQHNYVVRKLYGAKSYTNELTHRSVFSRDGELLEPLSCLGPGSRAYAPSKCRVPVTRTVSGVTANLYGVIASAEGNYLHWFVDALARLFMIEKFHSIDDIDYVLVPPLKYDFHWDALEALGFDRSKVIELRPLECFEFECLLASSWPRGKGSAICPGWVIDRYQETLLVSAANTPSIAGKHVYVSRRDAPTRMFSNEDEVCDVLEKRGIDIVELTPLNLWEKIAVFRDAEIIISQTGAGLTNLMFCNSDVKVLELVDEQFVYPLYASLAVYQGGTHRAHYFSDENAMSKTNAVVAKSALDIPALIDSVESLIKN